MQLIWPRLVEKKLNTVLTAVSWELIEPQEGKFDETMMIDGRWVPGRRLNGDETDHDRRWPGMRTFWIYGMRVYWRD